MDAPRSPSPSFSSLVFRAALGPGRGAVDTQKQDCERSWATAQGVAQLCFEAWPGGLLARPLVVDVIAQGALRNRIDMVEVEFHGTLPHSELMPALLAGSAEGLPYDGDIDARAHRPDVFLVIFDSS